MTMKFAKRQAPAFGRRDTAEPEPVEVDPVEELARAAREVNPDYNAAKAFYAQHVGDQIRKMGEAHDTEHWFAVNFDDRAQKDAALKALGLFDIGDKYVDGREASRALVELLRDPAACAVAADALAAMLGDPRPALPRPKTSERLRRLVRR